MLTKESPKQTLRRGLSSLSTSRDRGTGCHTTVTGPVPNTEQPVITGLRLRASKSMYRVAAFSVLVTLIDTIAVFVTTGSFP